MRKMIFSVFATIVALSGKAQVTTAYIYPYDECVAETEVRDADNSPTEQNATLQESLGFFYDGFLQLNKYMDRSRHDLFGKRSIDLMSDMWSGDVAMPVCAYGWFHYDEQINLANRRHEIWFMYYRLLYAINKGIVNFPSANMDEPTAYAELLAIRGYIYSCLASLYGNRFDDAICCPIYTEDNYQVRFESMNTREQVCAQAISDLESALAIMEAHQHDVNDDKLEIDRDIVNGLLAHIYLNAAVGSVAYENTYLQQALSHATAVIEGGNYSILPSNELMTNGFNNVESANWIWGLDVDTANTGKLKSFFGHVDIYTYSYAGVGDYKVIDSNLYTEIPSWDERKNWFYYDNYGRYIPYRKFFSGVSTSTIGDRNWLSDDVFMRIEALYLIAAEASWRLGDYVNAKNYLFALTDTRCKTGSETDYNTWKNSLNTIEVIKEQIIHNWRLEMWGEGYAYETMRRWNHVRTRGSNHIEKPNVTITATDIATLYPMPYPYVTDSLNNYKLDSLGHAIFSATGEEVSITFYVEGCEIPQGIYTCMAGDSVEFYLSGENPQPIMWDVISGNNVETSNGISIVQWVASNITVIAHVNTEANELVQVNQIKTNDMQKFLRDGQIFILRGEKVYTLTGHEVR